MARQRADWERFALLLSLLEGCRQNNTPLDPVKWLPPDLRPVPVRTPVTKAEVKAFSGFLAKGKSARRKGS